MERLKTGSFDRHFRIKDNRGIRSIMKGGARFSVGGAKLFVVENGLSFNRVAFTFIRNYGTAVERNRSRRLSREVYRRFMRFLRTGHDLVFLVYPGGDSFATRCRQFRALCKKSRLADGVENAIF